MNARYKINDEFEDTDITSITFKADEVDDLVAELESELEVESDKDEETEPPAVAKLLRRWEELQGKFDDEADEADEADESDPDEGEEDSECENARIVKLAKAFAEEVGE